MKPRMGYGSQSPYFLRQSQYSNGIAERKIDVREIWMVMDQGKAANKKLSTAKCTY
jgi:hypothetical protein